MPDQRLHPRHLQLLALLVGLGRLTIGEAVPLLGVTQPQTQRLANRLVEAGLATRQTDGKNLRFIYRPTPAGRALDAQTRTRLHMITTTEDTAA